MFVGHYSAALAAKAAEPRVPLWTLLIAAQFVDVFWALFILSGIEHARLDPSLPSNPLVLEHMPYTHGLFTTIGWSLLAYAATTRIPALGGSRRAGLVVGLVIASHWFLDLLVHRPDLPLWGDSFKMGFALWEFPMLALGLELILLLLTASLCAAKIRRAERFWRFIVVLVLIQFATTFGPLPPSLPAMAASVLVFFLAVGAAGRWVERRTAPS